MSTTTTKIKVTRKPSTPPAEAVETRDFMTSDPPARDPIMDGDQPPAVPEPAPPALAEPAVDVDALIAGIEAGEVQADTVGLPPAYQWGDEPGQVLAGQIEQVGFAEQIDDKGVVSAPLCVVLRDAEQGGSLVTLYSTALLDRRFGHLLGLAGKLPDKDQRDAEALNEQIAERARQLRGLLIVVVFRGLGEATQRGWSRPRRFDVLSFGKHAPLSAAQLARWRAAVVASLGGAPAAGAKVADDEIPF